MGGEDQDPVRGGAGFDDLGPGAGRMGGESRERWTSVDVPCVGHVPRVAGTELAHSSGLIRSLVRLEA